jgi:hypothetical protein
MSCQRSLRFDEDFVEDCRQSALPAGAFVEFGRCYGCLLTFPQDDMIGGFCATCADINEEEDATKKNDCLDKGPGPARPGGSITVPVANRLAAQ